MTVLPQTSYCYASVFTHWDYYIVLSLSPLPRFLTGHHVPRRSTQEIGLSILTIGSFIRKKGRP